MNQIISKLIIYGNLQSDCILMELADICVKVKSGEFDKDKLVTRIYRQIKKILIIATDYGFDRNLWQNYLTYLLITDENPFSITCEKVGANEGSVNHFAKNDFRVFMELFHYDFTYLENTLEVDCFSTLSNYHAIGKPELMYNKNVSEKVRTLSEKLAQAHTEEEFFTRVTDFYKDFGVGMFRLNKAFRIAGADDLGHITFQAINNMDKVMLSDLIGYEIQKKKLIANTKAFVEGRKANNVLLFGDSGTGKSTSIKAIVNEFYDKGLRMIEIYKAGKYSDLCNL